MKSGVRLWKTAKSVRYKRIKYLGIRVNNLTALEYKRKLGRGERYAMSGLQQAGFTFLEPNIDEYTCDPR